MPNKHFLLKMSMTNRMTEDNKKCKRCLSARTTVKLLSFNQKSTLNVRSDSEPIYPHHHLEQWA